MKTQRVLTHTEAQAVLNYIRAELEQQGLAAAVAVVDDHGELMAFVRTDGCPLASIVIAQNKAFSAARERRETRTIGESSRQDAWPLTNFGDLRYVGWGGGVPLRADGLVIGGVGVSGLPEEVDMELARAGAAVLEV